MKVYCIENKINGKKYVGITKGDILRRFKRHKEVAKYKDKKQHLHKAMLKHGIDNFVIYQIDETDNIEMLYEKEKFWIKKLDTKNNGYNETDGGEGSFGRILSEETKRKISKSHSGKTLKKEHKEAIKQSMLGQHQGKKNPFYGKKHTEESIQKRLQHRGKCIYCGIEATTSNIKRWHNDNCKKKVI